MVIDFVGRAQAFYSNGIFAVSVPRPRERIFPITHYITSNEIMCKVT